VPTALFKLRLIPQGSQSIGLSTLYDVSPDGSEFLVMGRGQLHDPVRPYRVPVEGGAVKLLPFGSSG